MRRYDTRKEQFQRARVYSLSDRLKMASTSPLSSCHLLILANPCCGMTEEGPKMGKTKGTPPRMAFLPSNTDLLDTNSCSWLLTLQETMVQPWRLMVQVVLLPRSSTTTGGDAIAVARCGSPGGSC